MIEQCPVCGRPIFGSDCIYCEMKKSFSSSAGGSGAPAGETPAPVIDPRPQIDIPVAPVPAPAVPEPYRDDIPCKEVPNVEMGYSFEDTVTTYGKDEVVICKLQLKNRDDDLDLVLALYVDGKEDFVSTMSLKKGEAKAVDVTTGAKRFRVEYGTDYDMTVAVSTSNGTTIGRKTHTVHVRPVFDIRLKEIKQDIPMWVTSNSKEVKGLLVSGSAIMGALKANGYPLVSGYQGDDQNEVLKRVIVQMKSVYEGLRTFDMEYVSDTKSMGNNLTYNYQRVKLPKNVLEERSGNCIELSCLFASVFEAMGLYPVIVFPPGHAMVGVVVSSKRLPSVNKFDFKDAGGIVKLNIKDCGDGSPDVLQAVILEATCVCSRSTSFDDALRSAAETMSENMKRIADKEEFTVLQYKRRFEKKRPMNW